jgi:signal transduction histidine kinase
VPLRQGRLKRAVLHLAVANWSIAIIAATIATFCWPLMVWTALLPSVLAASLLSGRELAAYVATSVVVSFAVVLVGLLQDFSGFSGRVDEWVRDTVLIITAPGLVALVALMAWQNSTSMQSMLSDVTRSRAELADQADELRQSRARVVAATDRERRRIERDLHDGAQQRLIGIGIGLSRARALCESDPATAAGMLDALREQLRSAHDDVRDLAQGVYPPVLTEHGLEAALQSAADRSTVPVTISLGRLRRHPPGTEAAVYFCCVEALQNAAKHGSTSRILLAGDADDQMLWISVTDDGGGFDPATATAGTGIIGMRDRLGSIGGRLEVVPSPGGSTVRCVVPIATN